MESGVISPLAKHYIQGTQCLPYITPAPDLRPPVPNCHLPIAGLLPTQAAYVSQKLLIKSCHLLLGSFCGGKIFYIENRSYSAVKTGEFYIYVGGDIVPRTVFDLELIGKL